MEDIKERQDHEKIEDAGFRTGASAGEPCRSSNGGTGEMAGKNGAAVRHGVEKGLSEIETRVHADRKPQRARSVQRETPKQAAQYYSEDPGRSFARIRPMDRAKQYG